MNILDILRQDKNYRLGEKIEGYGRVYLDNGTEKQSFIQDTLQAKEDIKDVIDFKDADDLGEGCELYFENEKYPMRVCPQNDRALLLHNTKRLVPTLFRTFKKSKIISGIYLLINWKEYVDFIHFSLQDVFYPDIKYYNQPVREIYRALSEENIDKIRDISCAILEFDDGYRYPFQYVLSKLDKDLFNKNPIREIKRLFNIIKEVKGGDFVEDKGFKILMTLLPLLRFNKKLMNILKKIVSKIDLDEIEMSKEDMYWSGKTSDKYIFDGYCYEKQRYIDI